MQNLSIIDNLPIKKYRFSIAMLYGGFPKWGYPTKMDGFNIGNPNLKCMI